MSRAGRRRIQGPKRFRNRIFWSVIPIFVVFLVVVGAITVAQHERLAEQEFRKRGEEFVASLSYACELGVLSEDTELLGVALRKAEEDGQVAYILVHGGAGQTLAQGGRDVAQLGPETQQTEQADIERLEADPSPYSKGVVGDGRYMEFLAPILLEQLAESDPLFLGGDDPGSEPATKKSVVGWVRLGLSMKPLHEHTVTILRTWVLFGAVFLTLAVASVIIVSRRITWPIHELTEQARQIQAGNFRERVEIDSRDEVGQLASSFNEMAGSLEGSIDERDRILGELRDLNENLEDRIRERTAALQRSSEALEEKSRELEAANRHKSEFLANMSHELRTPLNAVIGFSEVLLERMFGELNEKQEDYLNDILSSGRHLLSLINDILDLSKIEAGRMELEIEEFDVPAALANALTLVKERALRHQIQLASEVPDGIPPWRGDERKFKQVLLNLLSNAVKFTPERGSVTLSAAVEADTLHVSVRDTGVGIEPEDQKKIFEAFRQAKTGQDGLRKSQGTGLGLTLSRKMVELHGGRLWVESQLGSGSTFHVTLPRDPERPATARGASAEDARGEAI